MRQKAPTEHTQHLSIVVLYEDDIDRLLTILNMSGSATVSLEHGAFIFDTLNELRNAKGDVIRELRLKSEPNDDNTRHRSSLVSFDGSHVHLYFDATHELAFLQAKDFLSARRAWTAKVPTSVWFGMTIVIFFSPIVVFNTQLPTDGALPFWTNAVAGALLAWPLAGFWFLLRIFQRHNVIYLKKRHEIPRFVKRHESTIVKSLIGLGGSIIGYVIRLIQE